jgi:hypothetical protein
MQVWKFSNAPEELRVLHSGQPTPDWLALIPRQIQGDDLDRAIQASVQDKQLFRYKTAAGDMVLAGLSKASDLLTFLTLNKLDSANL